MKITAVRVIPLSYDTDDDPPRKRSFAVVRVSTDEGIVGWGEASDCYGHRHPLAVKALVDEDIAFALAGQDPEDIHTLMTKLRYKVYASLGDRELVTEVLSAIEIALWDIKGKASDQSISTMIGRVRDTIPLYAAGKPALSQEAGWHVDFFANLLERGVRAVKVRPGRDLEWDKRFVQEVRHLLPDGIELFVDGKYNYFPKSALELARVLGDIGAGCFEEPVIDTDLSDVAWLANASPVPLGYGEHSFRVNGFGELLNAGVRILEPDATVCGGISEALEIASMARGAGQTVMPHMGGLTAIGLSANLQWASSLSGDPFFEYDARTHQPLRDLLAPDAALGLAGVHEGRIRVPSGPGLGLDIDESVLDAFPYIPDAQLSRNWTKTYGTPHI